MKRNKLFIGSRASKLALIYANKVKNEISKHYNKEIIIKEINTTGDNKIDIRLSELGGKGLFSKNIENELLNKNIDLAVHALKDLPSFDTEGLVTNCFLKRNNSWSELNALPPKFKYLILDVLVNNDARLYLSEVAPTPKAVEPPIINDIFSFFFELK